jgi:hypothetical protein
VFRRAIHGVAPNANLHLLKMKGQFNSGDPGAPDKTYALQVQSILSVFNEVRRHVIARLDTDPDAKSVINMSWGV